jgi:hypothetical protein
MVIQPTFFLIRYISLGPPKEFKRVTCGLRAAIVLPVQDGLKETSASKLDIDFNATTFQTLHMRVMDIKPRVAAPAELRLNCQGKWGPLCLELSERYQRVLWPATTGMAIVSSCLPVRRNDGQDRLVIDEAHISDAIWCCTTFPTEFYSIFSSSYHLDLFNFVSAGIGQSV